MLECIGWLHCVITESLLTGFYVLDGMTGCVMCYYHHLNRNFVLSNVMGLTHDTGGSNDRPMVSCAVTS